MSVCQCVHLCAWLKEREVGAEGGVLVTADVRCYLSGWDIPRSKQAEPQISPLQGNLKTKAPDPGKASWDLDTCLAQGGHLIFV